MTAEINSKSLSQKPLGYILAVLGGTLGAPIGWITSPVVLLILNNIMKEKDNKHPNRFLVWSLIGIIGVPLSLAPVILSGKKDVNVNVGSIGSDNKITNQETKKIDPEIGVNMKNYLKLGTGISYQEAINILGEEGEEMTSNEMMGTKTIMYKWDADSGFGSNMNATFQDDKLVSKAQFGLK